MKRLIFAWAAAVLLLGGVAGRAAAGSIVIGSGGSANVFPFGTNFYQGEYQQLYAAGAFPGPVTITGVAFSTVSSFSGFSRTDNVTVGLSTTSASVSSPSSNYAANKGADFTTVSSGPLAFTALGNNTFDLVIPVMPFAYDPSGGNLLLDVVVNSSSGSVVGFNFGPSSETNRVYNDGGNGPAIVDGNEGLLTEFITGPAVAAPEPASLTLLGLGSLGLAGYGRRRRKA